MEIDNFKYTREDKDLFPYECGAEDYRDMMQICFAMFKLEELFCTSLPPLMIMNKDKLKTIIIATRSVKLVSFFFSIDILTFRKLR